MAGGYGFLDVDVKQMVKDFDKKPAEETAAPELSRAEELASNEVGDTSREREIRNAAKTVQEEEAERMKALAGLYAGREDDELEKSGRAKVAPPEYQSSISAAVRDSLALDNVQRMVALRNQANMRKGVGRDPGDGALKKAFAKGQTSTVAVPTQLLRSVAQEIGSLSSRTSQNDIMTGFLYWYFGRPAGIQFASQESEDKINEIVERLGANASPARAAQAGANTTEAMLDKLDILSQRMDSVAALLQILSKDSLGIKSRTDKAYIAICYSLLNMLMFAPPVAPGQRPEDIDLLAGGSAWALMSGVDEAYEYFKTTNGREIYKAKHGVKAAAYKPPVPSSSAPYEPPRGMYDPADDVVPDDDGPADDDYDDIPDGFDPLTDDFDNMGIGADFNPSYMSDPDYDDGIEEGTPEYLKKMREEARLKERVMKMEADADWTED